MNTISIARPPIIKPIIDSLDRIIIVDFVFDNIDKVVIVVVFDVSIVSLIIVVTLRSSDVDDVDILNCDDRVKGIVFVVKFKEQFDAVGSQIHLPPQFPDEIF